MGLFDVGENNVGQFGADNSNIIRYKQAAEYAEDARLLCPPSSRVNRRCR